MKLTCTARYSDGTEISSETDSHEEDSSKRSVLIKFDFPYKWEESRDPEKGPKLISSISVTTNDDVQILSAYLKGVKPNKTNRSQNFDDTGKRFYYCTEERTYISTPSPMKIVVILLKSKEEVVESISIEADRTDMSCVLYTQDTRIGEPVCSLEVLKAVRKKRQVKKSTSNGELENGDQIKET